MRPVILNGVARQAEIELLIVFVTEYGPILRTPLARSTSAARTISRLEAPPDDAIRPVRTLETSLSSRPASSMACCIEIKA